MEPLEQAPVTLVLPLMSCSWCDYFYSAWRGYEQERGAYPDAALVAAHGYERDTITGDPPLWHRARPRPRPVRERPNGLTAAGACAAEAAVFLRSATRAAQPLAHCVREALPSVT
ncbi:hypothetical protein ACWDG1_44765, partial [Streptomyces sp. NPDC001177]